MRKLRLEIKGLKPISVNAAYYKSRMIYTREAKAYIQDFLSQLKNYDKEMGIFAESFNKNNECLKVVCSVFMPNSEMYTKEGYISNRSSDVDNMNKVMVDCLFNQKQIQKAVKSFMVRNVNIDDKFIYNLSTAKYGFNQDTYLIIVDITIESNHSANLKGQKILSSTD